MTSDAGYEPRDRREAAPIHESYARLLLALTAVIILAQTACPLGQGSGDEEEEPKQFTVDVVVDNRNWQNMVIYAVRGGSRVRLGTATSMNTVTFVVTSDMTGAAQFQLLADPIGGPESFTSLPLRIEPGDVVEWRLAANLTHSAIFVR